MPEFTDDRVFPVSEDSEYNALMDIKLKQEPTYSSHVPKNIDTYGENHISSVRKLTAFLMDVHVFKESKYKGSWIKRGHLGVWFNLTRPLDRIENTANEVSNTGDYSKFVSRSFFNALMDMALYCLKWAAVISELNPEILKAWLEESKQ